MTAGLNVGAVAKSTKDRDVECWRKWKTSNSPEDLQTLLNQMNPIIQREVNKWAASISRSLLEAEAKRLAVIAFREYDPHAGTQLSTFLVTRLQKLSRLVYSTQNAVRMPESKVILFHTYHGALNELREKHGRDPTAEEMCQHLSWSPKKLKEFQREGSRKEFVESEDHPSFADEDSEDQNLIDFIYHDLTPLQQKIFEYKTGYLNAPQLSGGDICKKLKITQGQLSYQISLIEGVIKKAQGTRHGSGTHGGL